MLWNDLDELKLQMNKKTFKISLREKMLNEQTDQDDQQKTNKKQVASSLPNYFSNFLTFTPNTLILT